MSVVLPAPLGPRRPKTSPRPTDTETPSRARIGLRRQPAWKVLWRSLTDTTMASVIGYPRRVSTCLRYGGMAGKVPPGGSGLLARGLIPEPFQVKRPRAVLGDGRKNPADPVNLRTGKRLFKESAQIGGGGRPGEAPGLARHGLRVYRPPASQGPVFFHQRVGIEPLAFPSLQRLQQSGAPRLEQAAFHRPEPLHLDDLPRHLDGQRCREGVVDERGELLQGYTGVG